MRYNNRERFAQYVSDKRSPLIVIVALIVLLLPLALPVLLELNSQPVSMDKPSKYTAALALAQAGVEKAIWEMNNGDILSWEGDRALRTRTLSFFKVPGGEETGEVEIRVKWPHEQYPVVEAVGRVAYTSSFKKGMTARFVVERKARTVLQRDGYVWVSVFPEVNTQPVPVVQGAMVRRGQ